MSSFTATLPLVLSRPPPQSPNDVLPSPPIKHWDPEPNDVDPPVFPNEILSHILGYLSKDELWNIRTTSAIFLDCALEKAYGTVSIGEYHIPPGTYTSKLVEVLPILERAVDPWVTPRVRTVSILNGIETEYDSLYPRTLLQPTAVKVKSSRFFSRFVKRSHDAPTPIKQLSPQELIRTSALGTGVDTALKLLNNVDTLTLKYRDDTSNSLCVGAAWKHLSRNLETLSLEFADSANVSVAAEGAASAFCPNLRTFHIRFQSQSPLQLDPFKLRLALQMLSSVAKSSDHLSELAIHDTPYSLSGFLNPSSFPSLKKFTLVTSVPQPDLAEFLALPERRLQSLDLDGEGLKLEEIILSDIQELIIPVSTYAASNFILPRLATASALRSLDIGFSHGQLQLESIGVEQIIAALSSGAPFLEDLRLLIVELNAQVLGSMASELPHLRSLSIKFTEVQPTDAESEDLIIASQFQDDDEAPPLDLLTAECTWSSLEIYSQVFIPWDLRRLRLNHLGCHNCIPLEEFVMAFVEEIPFCMDYSLAKESTSGWCSRCANFKKRRGNWT